LDHNAHVLVIALLQSNGKNVQPQPLEDAVCASPLIKHALLMGQDKRELVSRRNTIEMECSWSREATGTLLCTDLWCVVPSSALCRCFHLWFSKL
jgi:hypothetical protein